MLIVFSYFIACDKFISTQNGIDTPVHAIKSLLFEQERFLDALDEIEKALRQNINDATLLYLRGMAQLNLKNYDKAMADFTTAMRIEPENPLPFNGIGNIFYLKFEDILAEKFWARGLAISKKPSERAIFLGNMALLAMNEKKYSEAIRLLEDAQKISPDGRYKNLLGRAYHAIKNSQKAQEIWLSALSDSSLPWAQINFKHNTHFRLAELYYSKNNYQEALKYCENALLLSPGTSEYQKLYVQLKQKTK